VVAREIRSLADQSIRATSNVRNLLEDISQSIRSTVVMTEKGAERVSTSVEQVRTFGANMRQLSSIMQDSSLAVRQISAAVNQQSKGVVQIFDAIKDLNDSMNDTMERVKETGTATVDVRGIATQVNQLVTRYGWKHADGENDPPRRP
jgi:methyl-accepting chemotaxis protein